MDEFEKKFQIWLNLHDICTHFCDAIDDTPEGEELIGHLIYAQKGITKQMLDLDLTDSQFLKLIAAETEFGDDDQISPAIQEKIRSRYSRKLIDKKILSKLPLTSQCEALVS